MHNFFLVNIQNNMHASPIFHFTIFFLMIILRNNAWLRQSLFRNQRFMLNGEMILSILIPHSTLLQAEETRVRNPVPKCPSKLLEPGHWQIGWLKQLRGTFWD